MTVLEFYNDFIHGGDPYIREYFFLRSIKPMVVTVICYVLFVTYVGPMIMKPRKALDLRKLIIFHNCVLVIYYIYFLLGGLYFLLLLGPKKIFCDCSLDSRDPLVANFYTHGYVMYCVRFVELIDTVFLVLTKKFRMITPLHVFHHAVVPVFGWFGFRTEKSAYLAAFMTLNSIVHVIMYSYYTIAALGPKYQKYIWWKKYLTFLQIGQFLITAVFTYAMYAAGCATSVFMVTFNNFLCVLFFFWFIIFYRQSVLAKKLENKCS